MSSDRDSRFFNAIVHNYGDNDVLLVTINEIAIPIYIDGGIDSIPLEQCDALPSMADWRNGIWDCLMHFRPRFTFITRNPDLYIARNASSDDTKVIILDVLYKDKNEFIMGAYNVHPKFGRADTKEKIDRMKRICFLINLDIGTFNISHLNRTLKMLNELNIEEESFANSNCPILR